jgi:putative aldouronate transport system substrate-binding protein
MKKRFSKILILMILGVALMAQVFASGGKEPASGSMGGELKDLDYDATMGGMKAPANRGDVVDIPFKAKEPLKFSMSFSDASWYALSDSWRVFDDIKNATNCELDLVVIPFSDYNNKRSLLISTGDQPLIMPKSYPGTEVPFIPSGQILAVSDYIDYMPNFKATVKAWKLEPELKTITQRDGKFYVLPGFHETFAQDYSLCFRVDILKKHNIPVPDSWAEIEDVLRKLKALYPDMYPYSERWQMGSVFGLIGPAFGLSGGTGLKTATVNWNNNNCLHYSEKEDKFYFYPTRDEYKAILTYFARLIKEGLMDPESVSQTDDQAKDKFVNGKSFLIGCNGQEVNGYRTKMDETLGKGNYEVMRINVPAGPAGGKIAGTRIENGVMISSKAKDDPHFLELLRLVDWVWYSYAGQELTKWGIEGKTYKFENGKYSLLPGIKFPSFGLGGGGENDIDLRIEWGYGGGNLILSYGGPKQLQYSYMDDETRAFVQQVNATREILKPAPVVLYDEDELEAQNMTAQPLMDYVFQMTYKFILGQADLNTEWNSFVDQCNTKGAQRYIDKANEVYKTQM